MNLRQLEYLDALARERNFRRAAEACNATQPAVSVAIAKLEGELGVEVVHRHRREAVLTAPGESLVRWARVERAMRTRQPLPGFGLGYLMTLAVVVGAVLLAVAFL